jgi:hypothetical protein
MGLLRWFVTFYACQARTAGSGPTVASIGSDWLLAW